MIAIKEILSNFNELYWFDYSNISEFNKLHKDLIKYFYDSIPEERLVISLNIIDDIILKIYDNDKEKINDYIFKLREQILYMLSFQKTIKEDQKYYPQLKNKCIHLLIFFWLILH